VTKNNYKTQDFKNGFIESKYIIRNFRDDQIQALPITAKEVRPREAH
jgi:hypothetical protein